MRILNGRTWKGIEPLISDKIKEYLIENGGVEQEVKSPYEEWRIKFFDTTFTYYKRGTLYSTPPKSMNPAVFEAWEYIDQLVGSRYVVPTKDFLIGLDETGKGEVIGHTILTGAIFPKELFKKIDLIVGPADTKKRHPFEYWDGLYKKLDHFKKEGLDFIFDKIPPWDIDRYNLNQLMDITYQRILNRFFREVDIPNCRIVIDDYGVGSILKKFLKFLEDNGAEVIVTTRAEDTYLEVKVASIISKWHREAVIKAINKNPKFQIDGLSVGSGNAADKQTIEWLEKWWQQNKSWPWFVKTSFKTIREIEGRIGEPQKETPSLDESILSEQFLNQFNGGNLSIQSLSLVCPYCGEILKHLNYVGYTDKEGKGHTKLRCPNCKKIIEHAGITLRYYCGYLLPDSSFIRGRILSKDLKSSKVFENFTVILSPVVRKECDGTPGGKNELDALAHFSSIGRIKLETVGNISDIPDGLPNVERDEMIIEDCLKYNAILLTADKSMCGFAIGRGIFVIRK
ncbi:MULTISPECIES: hypothetical protein [Thermococcus]|uniref:Ribonuclease n=1 Tax=Thermococcus sibiricus TaxID=172049 RepID=A0A124FFD0_9EURY|nr:MULTISPECIES: hypothetical protein [Thermococcus]KUK17721.1 MAG: Ribonuclease [Thermococcus sibiricus]MBC7095970.1 hypothetical protein [Thermococcus sp.]